MSKISMQDWARLGESLGGAYATYGENKIREGLNRGVQETQEFTPEQLKAYEEHYAQTGDVGEMTDRGLSYGAKPAQMYNSGTGENYLPGAAFAPGSVNTATGEYTQPGMAPGARLSPAEAGALVRPEKTAYSYGGLTQDKQFTPEQMAQQRDSQLQEFWQSSGQYGRDRMKEYGDEQTASQNRELQGIKIEEARLKQGFNAAAQKGPEGIAQFYDEQVPDGMRSKLVRGADGSITVHLIPDDGSNPEGTVWKTFKGDKKLGLTPEMEFTAEVQAKMNNPDTLLEIMKLRRQQASDEASARNAGGQIAAQNKPYVDQTTGKVYMLDVRSGKLADQAGKEFVGDASSLTPMGATPPRAQPLGEGRVLMPNGMIVEPIDAVPAVEGGFFTDAAPAVEGGYRDVISGQRVSPDLVRQFLTRSAGGKPGDANPTPAPGSGAKFSVSAPDGSTHSFDTQAAADKFAQMVGGKPAAPAGLTKTKPAETNVPLTHAQAVTAARKIISDVDMRSGTSIAAARLALDKLPAANIAAIRRESGL